MGQRSVCDSVKVRELAIANVKGVSLITDPEEIVVSLAAPHNEELPEDETAEAAAAEGAEATEK